MTADLVTPAERLYALLPQLYRIRDAEIGEPLKALVEVLATQVAVLEADLDQFYDDQFIETCEPWVTAYIGDLVGYRMLHGEVPSIASPRAEVANTIGHRRRKGTAAMLEQLARDVTHWPARAVESFELLVTTQYMNHRRLHAQATADVRDQTRMSWVTHHGGAFDTVAHTVDVRRINAPSSLGTGAGRFNIPDVAIFLWRVEAIRIEDSPLVAHDGTRRRFLVDPLGASLQLFADARTEDEISHIAEPFDVPLPLDRRWVREHKERYYGDDLSFAVKTATASADPLVVDVDRIRICDLSDGTGGTWAHEPAAGDVAVDPVLGRVSFGTALPAGTAASVDFHYGSAVPVGATGRHRADFVEVADRTVEDGNALQPHLDAIAAGGVLEITDNARYEETPVFKAGGGVAPAADLPVQVRATDTRRPLLSAAGPLRLSLEAGTTLVLDGLTIAGGPLVLEEAADAEVRTVVLRHCTLVPGLTRSSNGEPGSPASASLIVRHPLAQVLLESCVVGPVICVEGASLALTDCVVDASDIDGVAIAGPAAPTGVTVGDGMATGPTTRLEACTVIGSVRVSQLDASDSLFACSLPGGDPRPAPVWARRRQTGCIRFSALPPGSRTGRRYSCVDDVAPRFTSLRFGDPAFAQLRRSTPDVIRRGAHDESEMGASHQLYAPQREDNVNLRLEEYLRFGLEAGIFYAT